jgi:hypothetical protein
MLPPFRSVGFRKNAVGTSCLGAFLLHHIFAVAETASQFLYRNRKNVIYLFALNDISATCVFSLWKNERENSFLPHVYSSLRALPGAGTGYKKRGEVRKKKKEEF